MVQNVGFVQPDNLAPRVCDSGEAPRACHGDAPQRHRLTISKGTGVEFTVLVSLLYRARESTIRDSALIRTWEIKLHLRSCELASLPALTLHRDPSVSVCSAKSTHWQRARAVQQPCIVASCSLDSFTPQKRKTCGNHGLQRLLWSPLQQWLCKRHASSFGTCGRE